MMENSAKITPTAGKSSSLQSSLGRCLLQEQEDNEQVVREVVYKNKALQEEFNATCQALDVRPCLCCKVLVRACSFSHLYTCCLRVVQARTGLQGWRLAHIRSPLDSMCTLLGTSQRCQRT